MRKCVALRWPQKYILHGEVSRLGRQASALPRVTAKSGHFNLENRMKLLKAFGPTFLLLAVAPILLAQDQKAANPYTASPNVLLLAHQEILPGKTSARQKLEATKSRLCDRFDVPSHWIRLQALTGSSEALLFNPFESFEDMEQSQVNWRQFYAAHPDLLRMQEEIDAQVGSERTIAAVRRDDLGYLAESIDLAETRFMRVLEVRLFSAHETDFEEAIKILIDANTKIKADMPWVVYQVDLGTSSPTFLIFVPMSALAQNDDLLSLNDSLSEAEGEQSIDRLKQIARESYASTESNLYAIRPEMSHVSKEFAAGDPDYWRPRTETNGEPEWKPSEKPAKKRTYDKPTSQNGV